jgi:hypothetical protein
VIDCSSNSLTGLPALPDSLSEFYCEDNNITCFPTFPNTIRHSQFDLMGDGSWIYYFYVDTNPYNCLPNYLPNAMNPTDLAVPLCAAGNTNGCPASTMGIEQHNINNEVNIYPNPASGNFQVSLSGNSAI